jgi:hypothetical protein
VITRIQFRRGTADAWVDANPILAMAERGYEIPESDGQGRWKTGDGATNWVGLPYDRALGDMDDITDAKAAGKAVVRANTQAEARTAIDAPSNAERATGELCARMTVRPTRTRRTLLTSLISSLMTAGVWTKLDGFYVFAAHDVQAAKLNWVGCAQDVTAVNAPTFQIDRGFTGNGTSAYLDTNTAASLLERYKANDATMGVYSRTNTAGSNIIEISAGTKAYLNPAVAGAVAVRANSSAGSIINPSNGGVNTGLFAWSRDSTTAYVYRAGALLGSAAVAAGAVDAVNVTFSQYNSTNYSIRQLAAGFFGQGLSDTEHAALHAALLTYLTDVGANV